MTEDIKDPLAASKKVQLDISQILTNATCIQFRCTLILAGIAFDLKAQKYQESNSKKLLAELRADYLELQSSINRFNYMLQRPIKRSVEDEEQTRSP